MNLLSKVFDSQTSLVSRRRAEDIYLSFVGLYYIYMLGLELVGILIDRRYNDPSVLPCSALNRAITHLLEEPLLILNESW